MLFSEREGKRGHKRLPVSIHCLGKLLRKEGESMHRGKAVWLEEGGRAIHKRAVHKDNVQQREKVIGMLIDELERHEGKDTIP